MFLLPNVALHTVRIWSLQVCLIKIEVRQDGGLEFLNIVFDFPLYTECSVKRPSIHSLRFYLKLELNHDGSLLCFWESIRHIQGTLIFNK